MAKVTYKTPRLVEMRKRRMWTQEELATVAGIHVSTVRGAEQGHNIGPRSLRALAKALEVEPDELLRERRPTRSGSAHPRPRG